MISNKGNFLIVFNKLLMISLNYLISMIFMSWAQIINYKYTIVSLPNKIRNYFYLK